MSVIIKNADIDSHQTKKVGYTSIVPDTAKLNDSFEVDEGIEFPDIEETVTESNDNILPERDIPEEFEITELGIKHQGLMYIHPNKIDELVAGEVTEKVAELEIIVEQEKKSGFDEGLKNGATAAEEEQADKLEKMEELISSIEKSFELKVADVESILKDAIFTGVTRILGDALINDDERINMVHNVVKTISTSQPYTLRLSEHDYNILNNQKSDMKKFNSKTIISDHRVELGGCIVDTEKGIFDGRLEVQLARLKDVIDSKVD